MIELTNGFIAVSLNVTGYPIVIVNPVNYTIVKEIKAQKIIITHYSSLCVVDDCSFVYVYDGVVVQVSVNEDYKKCLVVTNTNKGLTVVKPCF